MTPVDLQVLLHYNYACNDYNNGDYSPAVRRALEFLKRNELIEVDAAHKAGAKAGAKARNEALLRRIHMAMDGVECPISGKVEIARFFDLLGVK